ncbi:RNA polymerase sigma-70 factor (ECF subfamily) [Pedobacter nutrimenti]|uniref:RNA polymerase sigma-70 factor (ECF subfamily) n=1 Tax=Pedobacter nutrimenti TaxID=1241337 RepID=A0A318UIC1_9SPHI|nr:RNA polymerase sigma-70 factor (ECF subfamily) [Pedobacter nutrimenti]
MVQDCRQGSRKAQFELYKLYAKAMYNVSLRILSHVAEAEDVLQEAFLEAFNRIADFRGDTTFGLWLKQIVINKSINYLRKRKVEFVSTDEVDVVEEEETDEEDMQLQVEEIRKAIQQLPDGYRVVISLYLLEGYDHEEIAHILKISEVTSRTQYRRAKLKLQSLMATERRSR